LSTNLKDMYVYGGASPQKQFVQKHKIIVLYETRSLRSRQMDRKTRRNPLASWSRNALDILNQSSIDSKDFPPVRANRYLYTVVREGSDSGMLR
jgi:hypothetical protein